MEGNEEGTEDEFFGHGALVVVSRHRHAEGGQRELMMRSFTYGDVVPPADPVTKAFIESFATNPFSPAALDNALLEKRPRKEKGG